MTTDICIALFIAMTLNASTILIYEKSKRIAQYWFVFPITFFGIWAAGLWINPAGDRAETIYWAVFMIAGVLAAFSLAFLSIERAPQGRNETIDMLNRINRKKKIERATYLFLYVFFFLIVMIMFITAGIRYL